MLKPGNAVQKSGSGKSADHTTPQRIPGEKNPSIQQSGLAGWRVGVLEIAIASSPGFPDGAVG